MSNHDVIALFDAIETGMLVQIDEWVAGAAQRRWLYPECGAFRIQAVEL